MAAPPNQVFSAFAFIGFVLSMIPLYWHLESWNTGTCLYMIWVGFGCLNAFINSVVWNGSARNVAPVWCDISTRFIIGLNVAIPAASLVINRRLYKIASMTASMTTRAEKRRAVIIDLAIGLGIPLLEMILQVIVQGHRFNIYEDVGCFPFTYNTPPAYPLVFTWPLVIGLVSITYAALAFRLFWKRSQQFKDIVSSNRNLNQSRYFRLMALSGTEMICSLPLNIYSLYLNTTVFTIDPWISWADTHFTFGRVDQFASVIWRNNPTLLAGTELSRWLIILCAFVFFAFFGFADEAQKHYRLAYSSVASKLGYSVAASSVTSSSFASPSKGATINSFKGGEISLPMFLSDSPDRRSSFGSSNHILTTSIAIEDFYNFDGIVKMPELAPAPGHSLDTPPPVPPKSPIMLRVPAHTVNLPSSVSICSNGSKLPGL